MCILLALHARARAAGYMKAPMGLDGELSALMRSAQDGDGRAYEALLSRIAALVRDFARSRLQRADFAEDVAQETLLAIHRDRHTYDPSRPFLPWMYAIARHRLLDFAARQRRREQREVAAEPDFDPPAPPASVDTGFVRRALALLPLRQRDIIRMLKLEGLSVAEISGK